MTTVKKGKTLIGDERISKTKPVVNTGAIPPIADERNAQTESVKTRGTRTSVAAERKPKSATVPKAPTKQAAFRAVLEMVQQGKSRAVAQANSALIETYWKVGAFLSQRVADAGWGKGVVEELAQWLSCHVGTKGFSAANLWRMKQFHEAYGANPILSSLMRELNWTQLCILMSQCRTPEEHLFYGKATAQGRWSVRELEAQIRRGAYERTELATRKLPKSVKSLPQKVAGVFKDSYLIDFADLQDPYREADLQASLVGNLRRFLLELGSGFTFVGEKVRLQVGKRDFELDLLFYHRDLRCMVAFELKTGHFEPEHLGQLSFYLEALDRDHRRPHENPTIGVLLCPRKDDQVVEYALSRTLSPALVAEYETKLVPRDLLRHKLQEWSHLLGDETGLMAQEVMDA